MKKSCCSIRLNRLFMCALVLMLLFTAAFAEETSSGKEGYIELSTEYPALTVKAGDNLKFDLSLENQSGTSQEINLRTESIPDGWTSSFSANSKEISLVHVKNEATNTAIDYALDIPLDAADGEYEVVLSATGDGISDTMTIYLKVASEEIGESKFEVEYPSQEGDADTTFSYSATLINNALSLQNYSFTTSAPQGWQVSIKPSGESTKVSALDVEARTTQSLTIEVVVPANIEAGEYPLSVTATSVNEKMTIDMTATVTGNYDVDLSTPSGRLSFDAYANKESTVQLTITNTGNTDLTNVNLTSSAPSGWTVRFATETIELIEAGATIETTAYVTPGEDAMSGDYTMTITAKNTNASDKAEFRITVKTETVWGFAGIGIIVLMALILIVIMRKFGRR